MVGGLEASLGLASILAPGTFGWSHLKADLSGRVD